MRVASIPVASADALDAATPGRVAFVPREEPIVIDEKLAIKDALTTAACGRSCSMEWRANTMADNVGESPSSSGNSHLLD